MSLPSLDPILSNKNNWLPEREKPSSTNDVPVRKDVEIGNTQWLIPEDFSLKSDWSLQWGSAWYEATSSEPEYLRDKTTNRLYYNVILLRFWLVSSMARTAIYDTAIVVGQICFRALKLISFAYFWMQKKEEPFYSIKGRIKDIADDIVKSIKSPFILLAQELAAIYGMIRPEDGQKLYASLQRHILPKEHLFQVLQPVCFSIEEKDYTAHGVKK